PAIVKFVGGSPQDALANTLAMTHITLARNGAFTLPALDFAGTPAGIDARRVVDTGILPVINTGIAHKEPGVGQIGAGVTRAPLRSRSTRCRRCRWITPAATSRARSATCS